MAAQRATPEPNDQETRRPRRGDPSAATKRTAAQRSGTKQLTATQRKWPHNVTRQNQAGQGNAMTPVGRPQRGDRAKTAAQTTKRKRLGNLPRRNRTGECGDLGGATPTWQQSETTPQHTRTKQHAETAKNAAQRATPESNKAGKQGDSRGRPQRGNKANTTPPDPSSHPQGRTLHQPARGEGRKKPGMLRRLSPRTCCNAFLKYRWAQRKRSERRRIKDRRKARKETGSTNKKEKRSAARRRGEEEKREEKRREEKRKRRERRIPQQTSLFQTFLEAAILGESDIS